MRTKHLFKIMLGALLISALLQPLALLSAPQVNAQNSNSSDSTSCPKGYPIDPPAQPDGTWGYGVQTPFQASHSGVDFMRNPGTQVYATGDGVVVWASWWPDGEQAANTGHGPTIWIKHDCEGQTLYSVYAHENPNFLVKVGDTVKKGQPISVVGQNGVSGAMDGTHLHYAIHDGFGDPKDGRQMSGSWMNPENFISDPVKPLAVSTPPAAADVKKFTFSISQQYPSNTAYQYNIRTFFSRPTKADPNKDFSGSLIIPAGKTEYVNYVFGSDGYQGMVDAVWRVGGNTGIVGGGVCNAASFLIYAASESGILTTDRTTKNHNLGDIPGVPLEYRTTIFFPENAAPKPDEAVGQDAWITNPGNTDVVIHWTVQGDSLTIWTDTGKQATAPDTITAPQAAKNTVAWVPPSVVTLARPKVVNDIAAVKLDGDQWPVYLIVLLLLTAGAILSKKIRLIEVGLAGVALGIFVVTPNLFPVYALQYDPSKILTEDPGIVWVAPVEEQSIAWLPPVNQPSSPASPGNVPNQVNVPSSQPNSTPPTTGTCEVSQKADPFVAQKYCVWITKYAHENGLEPNLVATIITAETGAWFHSTDRPPETIIATDGGVGLMQVMPRDGAAASFRGSDGSPMFADRPSIAELQNPEFNIKYGTAFLKQKFDQAGGNLWQVFKLYNGGGAYADKALGIYNSFK